MNIDTNNIKEILVNGNYISAEDAEKAEALAKQSDISFVDALLRDGVVNSDIVGQATAEAFNVPYADLNSAAIGADQIRKIPEEVAKKLRVVLFDEEKEEEAEVKIMREGIKKMPKIIIKKPKKVSNDEYKEIEVQLLEIKEKLTLFRDEGPL